MAVFGDRLGDAAGLAKFRGINWVYTVATHLRGARRSCCNGVVDLDI